MDQIVALVAEKTGLSKEMSQKAVETTVNFIKAKLPEPVAAQLDALLAGGEDGKIDAGDLATVLGGLFTTK